MIVCTPERLRKYGRHGEGLFTDSRRAKRDSLMKKHQFVKTDCNCPRRATYFTCKHCGVVEYCGKQEIQSLDMHRAACTGKDAPEATPSETFKSRLGGTIDCLAPDYETWDAAQKSETPGGE